MRGSDCIRPGHGQEKGKSKGENLKTIEEAINSWSAFYWHLSLAVLRDFRDKRLLASERPTPALTPATFWWAAKCNVDRRRVWGRMLYFSGKSGPSAWSSSYFPLSGLSTYFSIGSDLILPAHANRNASIGTVLGMSREKRPRQGDEVGRLKSGSLRCFARPQLPHFIH